MRVHDDLFPQNAQDVEWLRAAGDARWVVLTRDDRIRRNALEKQAVIAARLRFFSVTSSSLTGPETAELLVSAIPKIKRLCHEYAEHGCIATVSRGPSVKVIVAL